MSPSFSMQHKYDGWMLWACARTADSLRGFICTSGFRGAVYSLGLRATLPIPAVPLQRSTHASKRGESVARMDLSCPL